jgi:hypothetical protein
MNIIIKEFNEKGIELIKEFENRFGVKVDYSFGILDILECSGMFFHLDQIIICLENNITFKEFGMWYWDYWIKPINAKTNLINYIKYIIKK